MTSAATLDPVILGQILLLQSSLQVAPDEKRMAEILVYGLSLLPGVREIIACIEGISRRSSSRRAEQMGLCRMRQPLASPATDCAGADCQLLKADKGEERRFPLKTSLKTYGELRLHLYSAAALAPYEELISNTANVAALQLENARVTAELKALAKTMETRYREQTVATEASESRFQSLFEQADLGLVLLDGRGTIGVKSG
jgi:hypothetical protein